MVVGRVAEQGALYALTLPVVLIIVLCGCVRRAVSSWEFRTCLCVRRVVV